jgi:hypothetical protein
MVAGKKASVTRIPTPPGKDDTPGSPSSTTSGSPESRPPLTYGGFKDDFEQDFELFRRAKELKERQESEVSEGGTLMKAFGDNEAGGGGDGNGNGGDDSDGDLDASAISVGDVANNISDQKEEKVENGENRIGGEEDSDLDYENATNESESKQKFNEAAKSRPETVKHRLSFESRFESGNLQRAVKVGPFEYDLFIRPDINTNNHQQWWYFAVCNTHPKQWRQNCKAHLQKIEQDDGCEDGPIQVDASEAAAAALGLPKHATEEEVVDEVVAERKLILYGIGPDGTGLNSKDGSITYQFNIKNMYKPDSMYNRGMQPVVYSCLDAEVCLLFCC